MTETHYIKKQNIELVFPSEDAAQEQWESLMDFHKHEGHAIMADIFDRLAPGGNWIRIDSLRIDLGRLAARSFRQDYLDQLRSSLEKALVTAIANKKPASQADPVSVWETTIIHYLKSGTFLWETAMQSSSLLSDQSLPVRDKLEEKIIERLQSSGNFIRILGLTLRQNDTAMQRWIRQFSPGFYKLVKDILIRQSGQSNRSFLNASANLIEMVIAGKLMSHGFHYERSQQLKWNILFSGTTSSATSYLAEWISENLKEDMLKEPATAILHKGNDEDKTELINMLSEYPALFHRQQEQQATLPVALNKMIMAALPGIKKRQNDGIDNENKINTGKRNADTGDKQSEFVDAETGKTEITKKTQTGNLHDNINLEKIDQPRTDPAPGDKEIYIGNAGIVLLAPFIDPFFKQLGIKTENKLEDDADASLGIQLLQLAVTDTWDEEECRLVLNKILCGRSPEWAGYRIHDIPANARRESAELLQTVIHYWDALKSTSPEAIQQTFLQREGKLLFKDEQWQLWVEYKTHDILLESIPWSYSIIKLPWMQYPLYINW
ncbi:MAG: contractile injection system tape measure protein [Bacteroidota bacterium]|nr:contractile injection system tape measure protein [Bacteroidota bacterium]